MKGSITISDTIGTIGIIGLILLFITQIIPGMLSVIVEKFSSYSAENVARQLSNLITVSGSATHKIEIVYGEKAEVPSDYQKTEEVLYKIQIGSRTIKVIPKFKVNYAEKSSSTQYFAVNLPSEEYTDVNSFLIKKEILDGESTYAFYASKK